MGQLVTVQTLDLRKAKAKAPDVDPSQLDSVSEFRVEWRRRGLVSVLADGLSRGDATAYVLGVLAGIRLAES